MVDESGISWASLPSAWPSGFGGCKEMRGVSAAGVRKWGSGGLPAFFLLSRRPQPPYDAHSHSPQPGPFPADHRVTTFAEHIDILRAFVPQAFVVSVVNLKAENCVANLALGADA